MHGNSTVHPSLDDPNVWVPYRYHPTTVGAGIFIGVFTLTTILHIAQVIRHRTWYFIPLIVGGLCTSHSYPSLIPLSQLTSPSTVEIAGYTGRLVSTHNIWLLGPFIVQSVLLLVAPALFAASIYIILGRIILLVNGEKYSLIKQKRLTATFVAGDVLAFMTQAAGGGIAGSGTLSGLHTGQDIIVAGLFMQIIFFALFIAVAGTFHTRLSAALRERNDPEIQRLPWRKHLYMLYAASGLIMIRSVFRVIEYLMGNDGYLLRHEVFVYVFDAVLMTGVMVLFNFVHPSEITRLTKERAGGPGLVSTSDSLRMEMAKTGGEARQVDYAV
jgi:RTA1 like protein